MSRNPHTRHSSKLQNIRVPTCREEKPCVGEGSATRKTQTPHKSNSHSTPPLPILTPRNPAHNPPPPHSRQLTNIWPPLPSHLSAIANPRKRTKHSKQQGPQRESRDSRCRLRRPHRRGETWWPGDSDKVREMAVASPAGDDYMIRSSVG